MPNPPSDVSDWDEIGDVPSHGYLFPAALEWIRARRPERLLDLGCGDGRLTAQLAATGLAATGIDFSPTGIARARSEHLGVMFESHQLDCSLPDALHNAFDIVTAIEVIEHLLLPRSIFARADEALKPGGSLLVTTPFHGYWKNLALSLTNHWDTHHMVMSDHGHVKFFSPKTLETMGREMGFRLVQLKRVGRIPIVAASMVAVFERHDAVRVTSDN